MNRLNQRKFEPLPTSVLLWTYIATPLASTAFEQTAVFILSKRKKTKKSTPRRSEKYVQCFWTQCALSKILTISLAQWLHIWFTENRYAICTIHGTKTRWPVLPTLWSNKAKRIAIGFDLLNACTHFILNTGATKYSSDTTNLASNCLTNSANSEEVYLQSSFSLVRPFCVFWGGRRDIIWSNILIREERCSLAKPTNQKKMDRYFVCDLLTGRLWSSGKTLLSREHNAG